MKYIVSILIGYLASWIWIILPDRKFTKSPFIFYNFPDLHIQNYAEWAGARLLYICFAWSACGLASLLDFKEVYFKIILWLFVGYLIDYVVAYNQPYGYLSSGKFVSNKPEGFYIPISYSLVMGLSIIIITLLGWLSK